MKDMTDEEYAVLDKRLTDTVPILGPNGTGFFSRKEAALSALTTKAVEPLLSYLSSESAIETNLTDEEKNWVQEGRQHYKEHPEDFVPLENIK